MHTPSNRKAELLSWGNLLRVLLLLLVAGGAITGLLLQDEVELTDLRDTFAAAGAWAPLVFLAVYIVATVLALPGPLLTLTGGMLFGLGWGFAYSLTGTVVGGLLSFLIARYIARNWFEQRLGPRMETVKQGVDEEGWRFVLFARLTPVVPYSALNYGFGLTRIGLLPYFLASVPGMAPAMFIYSYLGDVGGRVLESGYDPAQGVLVIIALVAALLFLPRFISRLRRRFQGQGGSRN